MGLAGNAIWTLSQTGDTGAVADVTNPDTTGINFWTLTNTSTTQATSSTDLLGGPSNGNVIFDRDKVIGNGLSTGGQVGTLFSNIGITFSTSSFNPASPDIGPYNLVVTYVNIVRFLGPAQPCIGGAFAGNLTIFDCGDEWEVVTFAFSANAFWRGDGSTR